MLNMKSLQGGLIFILSLALGVFIAACDRADKKPGGAPENVAIAYSAITDTVLAEVAYVNGYFRQEGLEVTPLMHAYGKPALEDLLAGKADFATVAETPIMFAVMKGAKIVIIATIQTSDTGNAIVAKQDSGIVSLGDLKGKRIAATLGTTSDFFLGVILGINGIARKDITVINIKAEDMAVALERNDIDAISTFTPYVTHAKKKLGKRAIIFRDKDIYRWTYNIVSTKEFVAKNPVAVAKMLRALVRAETYVAEYPAESQKIVADFSGIDISIVRDIWADTSFRVSLDQPLILSLEDESRWAINNRLTHAREIPNYLDYIYLDGLMSVKPEAVRILK